MSLLKQIAQAIFKQQKSKGHKIRRIPAKIPIYRRRLARRPAHNDHIGHKEPEKKPDTG